MPRLVFVPSTPLLVDLPDVGDVPEVTLVREAARAAMAEVLADATSVTVLATDEPTPGADAGTLRPWGLAVDAGGERAGLGLGHTLGAWLLDDAGWTGERRYVATAATTPADPDPDVVLVVADGSARRTDRAPGHLDERAEPFDATLASALTDGDADLLGGVDDSLAADLWCTTAPTWRAAADLVAARTRKGAHVTARLRYDGAPLGVGWFVADWTVD